MKLCSKCEENKPLEDFFKNKLGKLGRYSICRPCVNSARREEYHADLETNRAKIAAEQRQIRAKRKQRGVISPDYVKFAAQQPAQYDRVKTILERSTERQVRRLCLQIIYTGKDKWRRFRASWKGDELLAQYLGG